MRVFGAIFLLLALAPLSAASERVQGFLTFGCDSYLRPRNVAETWFIDLSKAQRSALLAKAKVTMEDRSPWITLYVDVSGELTNTPRRGYTGLHPKQLLLQSILSARYPDSGETVDAALQPAKRYEGFLLAGEHGFGFVPFEQKDEFWWLVAGTMGWAALGKHHLQTDRFEISQVFVRGRVGPPGSYGAMNDYNREIAADELQFVRWVKPEELTGTAGVSDPNAPWGGIPAIDRCASPSSVSGK